MCRCTHTTHMHEYAHGHMCTHEHTHKWHLFLCSVVLLKWLYYYLFICGGHVCVWWGNMHAMYHVCSPQGQFCGVNALCPHLLGIEIRSSGLHLLLASIFIGWAVSSGLIFTVFSTLLLKLNHDSLWDIVSKRRVWEQQFSEYAVRLKTNLNLNA